MKILKSVLPHIVIILSGIFLVLLVLDQYNPTMNFVSNDVSLLLLWALSILSIVNSIALAAANRREARGGAARKASPGREKTSSLP